MRFKEGKENPSYKHGMKGTKVYYAWLAMRKRCYLKTNASYKDYGARGITVCKRWKESFEEFYKDMGDPPSKSHSLDRKNNEGNYHKRNCRWATITEQNYNRRFWKVKTSTGFRGVHASRNKFIVQVRHINRGTYSTAEEAAKVYDKIATKEFGKRAVLNFKKDGIK